MFESNADLYDDDVKKRAMEEEIGMAFNGWLPPLIHPYEEARDTIFAECGHCPNTNDDTQSHDEAYRTAMEDLLQKATILGKSLEARLRLTNKYQRSAGVSARYVGSHSIATYRRRRARAYRSPTRSTSSTSTASHNDAEGDGSGESSDPPALHYPNHPLSVVPKKSQFFSIPLAVVPPRHMSHGLSEGRRAA